MFHLRYTLSAPFDAVITAGAMRKYEELFAYLWRLKRVEYSLNRTWAAHMQAGQQRADAVDPRLGAILHRSRLQLREMPVIRPSTPTLRLLHTSVVGAQVALWRSFCLCLRILDRVHFVSNLSSYIMFEVLETSWGRLMAGLRHARDLDALQRAHDEYLHDIQHVSALYTAVILVNIVARS